MSYRFGVRPSASSNLVASSNVNCVLRVRGVEGGHEQSAERQTLLCFHSSTHSTDDNNFVADDDRMKVCCCYCLKEAGRASHHSKRENPKWASIIRQEEGA